jgi:hypothetical protein
MGRGGVEVGTGGFWFGGGKGCWWCGWCTPAGEEGDGWYALDWAPGVSVLRLLLIRVYFYKSLGGEMLNETQLFALRCSSSINAASNACLYTTATTTPRRGAAYLSISNTNTLLGSRLKPKPRPKHGDVRPSSLSNSCTYKHILYINPQPPTFSSPLVTPPPALLPLSQVRT